MKTNNNGYVNSHELKLVGFEFNGTEYERVTQSKWDKSVIVVEKAYEEDEDDKKINIMVFMQKWISVQDENQSIDDCEEEFVGSYDFYTESETRRKILIDKIF